MQLSILPQNKIEKIESFIRKTNKDILQNVSVVLILYLYHLFSIDLQGGRH